MISILYKHEVKQTTNYITQITNYNSQITNIDRNLEFVYCLLVCDIINLMKRALIIFLLTLTICLPTCYAATKFEYYPFNIRVKELLKTPTSESEAAFVFPIEISLTGVSKDKKWFRFKVFYDLVFFGKYSFEGWCQVDPWKPFLTNATPEVIEMK